MFPKSTTVFLAMLCYVGLCGSDATSVRADDVKKSDVKVRATKFSNLNPPTAETRLSVTVQVKNDAVARKLVLECEILDHWFRPSYIKRELTIGPNETSQIVFPLDQKTCERLFKVRYECGQNYFTVSVVAKENGAILHHYTQGYRFANLVKKYKTLPPLPDTRETVDGVFGKQKLVDEVKCYDPSDPHPYIEGGRGLSSKYTGAVPQADWKKIYREKNPHFATIETIAGQPCRTTHGWGWFAYKLNRKNLTPGKTYVLVLEYPEDVGRSYVVWNTGSSYGIGGDYGFHTGKTLGDHWTRTLNSEYVDYPLSGKYRKWSSCFHLCDKSWAPGDPQRKSWANSREGFWVVIGGVGPSMDPLTAGAAVRSIKLYEVDDVNSLALKVNRPPKELGYREIFSTSESNGNRRIADKTRWATERLHEARLFGFTGIAPNHWGHEEKLLEVNSRRNLGLKIFPRLMFTRDIFAKIPIPAGDGAIVIDSRGEVDGLPYPNCTKPLPDILHPNTLKQVCALLSRKLADSLSNPGLCGVMLFKHHGAPIMVSFSDFAIRMFEKETGIAVAGADSQAKRDWLLANKKNEYYQWWYGKKREFLLGVRDHLQLLRPDLKLFYFPWHSDDDFPFGCGRLRYSGYPEHDKIYVPGTNILLVPSYTVPRDKWSVEMQKHPAKARSFYREAIDPALKGQVTFEDILYGRHKDMKQFWGAKRNGQLPHLVYPHEMDMVKMLTEPGGMYANNVGLNPRLYRNDKGIVYWAPVHYKFTADNPELLDLFRTGEGVAVANCFPYDEEIANGNCMMAAPAVEHGGPFCMMEEVLSMANADPTYIMNGMWLPPKRGFPQFARAFAAAYLALPAVPSKVLSKAASPEDSDIVVRSYKTDYGTYLAVINRAFDLKRKKITLTVNPDVQTVESIENLVTGKNVPYETVADGKVRFSLEVEPMSLSSYRIVPAKPVKVFRDVRATALRFSSNGDGVGDTIGITGNLIERMTGRAWQCAICNEQNKVVRTFSGQGYVNVQWDGCDASGKTVADGDYHALLTVDGLPTTAYKSKRFQCNNQPPPSPTVDAATPKLARFNALTITGKAKSGWLQVWTDDKQKAIKRPVLGDELFDVSITNLKLGQNVVHLQSISPSGVPGPVTTLNVTFEPTWLKSDDNTLLMVDYTKGLDAVVAKGDPKAQSKNVVLTNEGAKIGKGAWLNYASANNVSLDSGTVEVWFKPDWDGDEKSSGMLFSEYAGDDQNRQFMRAFKHSNGLMYAGMGGNRGGFRHTITLDISDWKAGTWHHLKFTWTHDNISLTLDNDRSGRTIITNRPTKLESRFWVGSWKQLNTWSAARSTIRQIRIQNDSKKK